MTSYAFATIWEFDAPIDRVWNAITDGARYPEWWKYVASVEDILPGDQHGIGQAQHVRWRTALPYTFAFDSRVRRLQAPYLLEFDVIGDLVGLGRWELSTIGAGTRVHYRWQVHTTKRWMNLLAPVARPVFEWNHDLIMTSGGQGLARRLQARLLRNESRSANSEASQRTALAFLRGIVIGATVALVVRRLRRWM